MLAIFGKIRTGGSAFAGAHHFIFKFFIRCLRHFTNKYLVAVDSFFWIGTLKNNVLAVIAPVSFCIISAKSQLLNVGKMCFFGIVNGVGSES